MTTFDPVPIPLRTALTDFPSAAAAQASKLDSNFAKINSRVGAKSRTQMWRSLQTALHGGFYSSGSWNPISLSKWPAITLIMPDCQLFMVTLGASIERQDRDNEFYIGAQYSVGGVVQYGAAPSTVVKNSYSVAFSTNYIYVRGQLTPGSQYTWTPVWWSWNPTSCEIIEGSLHLTAMGVNL
jgi:hypothetical protein